MAKTRMNDNLRHQVGLALYAHAMSGRVHAMMLRGDELARRVFQEILTPEEHKLLKKMPKSWLVEEETLYGLNANGWKVSLDFYDTTKTVDDLKMAIRDSSAFTTRISYYIPVRKVGMPFAIARQQGRFNDGYIIKDHQLATDVQAFSQDMQGLTETSRELSGQISSTLSGFRHFEDVIKAIPDLETIAPDLKKQAIPSANALVPTAERLMCAIASVRGEERAGCKDGERLADKELSEAA